MPPDALVEFEERDEAKLVERMVEVEIVDELMAIDFERSSPEWRAFSAALVEYGYAVLVAWGMTGALGWQVARHGGAGRVRVPTNLRLSEDDARGLAADVLMVSIEKFRTKSLRLWNPVGGASLKTFFIGRCLLDLADVYQRWDRQERRRPRFDPREEVDDGRRCPRPDEEAEARVLAEQLLRDNPELRRALVLQAAGYELAEIALELGVTRASLRSRLYRARRRIASEGGTE